MDKQINKLLNRAENLTYIICGLGGAVIGLGIACALGYVDKGCVMVSTLPLMLSATYLWGLEDALDVIVEDK